MTTNETTPREVEEVLAALDRRRLEFRFFQAAGLVATISLGLSVFGASLVDGINWIGWAGLGLGIAAAATLMVVKPLGSERALGVVISYLSVHLFFKLIRLDTTAADRKLIDDRLGELNPAARSEFLRVVGQMRIYILGFLTTMSILWLSIFLNDLADAELNIDWWGLGGVGALVVGMLICARFLWFATALWQRLAGIVGVGALGFGAVAVGLTAVGAVALAIGFIAAVLLGYIAYNTRKSIGTPSFGGEG